MDLRQDVSLKSTGRHTVELDLEQMGGFSLVLIRMRGSLFSQDEGLFSYVGPHQELDRSKANSQKGCQHFGVILICFK